MSKLTAEKARERIAHLKSWQEQRGLTLREEEYLEGLQRMLDAEALNKHLDLAVRKAEAVSEKLRQRVIELEVKLGGSV